MTPSTNTQIKKLWAKNQITTVGKTGHTWKTVDIWNPLFENLLIDEKSLHLEQSSHYAGKKSSGTIALFFISFVALETYKQGNIIIPPTQ
jgi:hypothetical protein